MSYNPSMKKVRSIGELKDRKSMEYMPTGTEREDLSVCSRCEGCGQIDDLENSGVAWSRWKSYMPGSSLYAGSYIRPAPEIWPNHPILAEAAMIWGFPDPVVCPECGGSGQKDSL
jgi:hypothetical protein